MDSNTELAKSIQSAMRAKHLTRDQLAAFTLRKGTSAGVQPASNASNKMSRLSRPKPDNFSAFFSRPLTGSRPPRFLMVSIGDGGNIRAQTCQETHNLPSSDTLRVLPPRAVCQVGCSQPYSCGCTVLPFCWRNPRAILLPAAAPRARMSPSPRIRRPPTPSGRARKKSGSWSTARSRT